MNDKTFDAWWSIHYKGKLGFFLVEKSFKEVAQKAWDEQQKIIDHYKDQIAELLGVEPDD